MLDAGYVLENIAVVCDADKTAGGKTAQACFFRNFSHCAGDRVFTRLLLAFGKVPAASAENHKAFPRRVLHQPACSDYLMVRFAEQFKFAVISKCDTFVTDVYFMHLM